MNRNLLNLGFVLLILIFITACFCRSNRNSGRNVNPKTADSYAGNGDQISVDENSEINAKDKKADKGDFIVQHTDLKNPRYKEIDEQIKQGKELEKAAQRLNQSLILPHDIYMRTKDCGEANAFYDEQEHSVTVCYELMDHFYKLFKSSGESDQKAYEKMFDAVRFAFLHEIGHALIDTYNLPLTGNEEDAADRCSTYINLEELGDDGVRAVISASDAFKIESKKNTANTRNLADEHLLQEQRSYNSLCLTYGSNPEKFSYIVNDGYLPQERAARCPSEYERTAQSWSVLLAPWRKD